jgi:hypothetical protein
LEEVKIDWCKPVARKRCWDVLMGFDCIKSNSIDDQLSATAM